MLMDFLTANWAFIFGMITILAFVYRTTSKIDNLIGKDIKGRNILQRLDRIEYQLWPNEGQSIADKVNRLESCQSQMRIHIAEMSTKTDFIYEEVKANKK